MLDAPMNDVLNSDEQAYVRTRTLALAHSLKRCALSLTLALGTTEAHRDHTSTRVSKCARSHGLRFLATSCTDDGLASCVLCFVAACGAGRCVRVMS